MAIKDEDAFRSVGVPENVLVAISVPEDKSQPISLQINLERAENSQSSIDLFALL